MLIVIVYSEQFTDNAKSLSDAVKNKWSDVNVNLMGTRRTLYQVQLESKVVYSADSVTDNNFIIDLIEERL
tara:strand:+ start:568 stop:780 length:213 start_codon:yes stop_codon:yes gene_type:complete